MIQKISPTIFATDLKILQKKISLLSFSPVVHLDICDSKFVDTKTVLISDYFSFKNNNQEIEVHLMVEKPLEYLDDCIKLGVVRVFIQREVFTSVDEFILVKKQFNSVGIEVALVLNPSTSVEDSLQYLSTVKHTMLMSVVPGAEGQKFIGSVLQKVRGIKVLLPNMKLQIDGGINFETGELSLQKGIDVLSVGSFISSSKSPKKNYDALNTL